VQISGDTGHLEQTNQHLLDAIVIKLNGIANPNSGTEFEI